MRARARYGRIIAAGGAAIVAGAALVPAAAHAAPGDKFKVEKTGKILAAGAAVKVKFSYTCPAGWEGGAGITLVESLGDAFASGYGGKTIKCTGQKEEATFFVQANTYEGAKPFRPGPASIVANMDAWNPQGQCDGMPCPVPAEPAPAAGTGGKMSVPADTMPVPSNMHREFSGVIELTN